MQAATLKAQRRTEVGTRFARRLRNRGRVPCIIYGHGLTPETISLDGHDFSVALTHGHHVLELDLEGAATHCLIKDIQYDHMGIAPIHADLLRVDMNERVRVTVGVELRGVPKGVTHGGLLEQPLTEVEVECLALNIPDMLHPVVTQLEVGDSIYARDLPLPEGVTLVTAPDERIATVRAMSAAPEVEAAPPVEGEAAAAAEPERIGRVRAEEETPEKETKEKKEK